MNVTNNGLQGVQQLMTEAQQQTELAKARFYASPMGQAVRQFEMTQRMGKMLAESKIVPDSYRGNVADCAIAVDMAMRMNCNPLMVMQNLTVVYGRPSFSAQFLIACVNQCGRFTTLQYKWRVDGKVGKFAYWENEKDPATGANKLAKREFDGSNMDNLCCTACAVDKATGEVVEGSEVSIRMAVTERWYTKKGSKWQSMPKQMLMYRAATFFQRAYCPEVGMGFHSTEEVIDAEAVELNADGTEKRTRKQTLAEVASLAAGAMTAGAAGDVANAAHAADNAANGADRSYKADMTDNGHVGESAATDVKPKKTLL